MLQFLFVCLLILAWPVNDRMLRLWGSSLKVALFPSFIHVQRSYDCGFALIFRANGQSLIVAMDPMNVICI